MINHNDTKWARHSSRQCNAHHQIISQAPGTACTAAAAAAALPPLSQSSAQPRIQTENSRAFIIRNRPHIPKQDGDPLSDGVGCRAAAPATPATASPSGRDPPRIIAALRGRQALQAKKQKGRNQVDI